MAEKVLVTGAAGYIGSVLCRRLLETGRQVKALDLMNHNLPSLLPLARYKNFSFIRGDARNGGLLTDLVRSVDTVIPLAARVGQQACDLYTEDVFSTNRDSVLLILQRAGPDQRIVYPNTNSGYGTNDGICTEETEMAPLTTYAKAKMQAELMVIEHPSSVSLRLATVFGPSPRMRFDLLVNHFVQQAMTAGFLMLYQPKARRNYVHIEDVADAFIHVLDNWDEMEKGAYNVGNDDENCSKETLALKIQAILPKIEISIGQGVDLDRRDYEVSSKKLAAAGFTAKRTIRSGIFEIMKAVNMLPQPAYLNAPPIGLGDVAGNIGF